MSSAAPKEGSATPPADVLPARTIWLHGSMGLPLAVIGYPLSIWIPAHYAGELGLPLATVGTILMLARLSDVVTDPLIGEASDRTRTPLGRRRPYLLLGAPLMMLGAWCLFVPSEGAGLFYFLLWLTLFFLGSTLIQLPHAAWGAELSPDYHQRSRVTAGREVYVLAGLMLAAAVPMIVEVMADRGTGLAGVGAHAWQTLLSWIPGSGVRAPEETASIPRAALTGPVLEGLAWTVIVLLPVCALLVAIGVAEPTKRQHRRVPLSEGLKHLKRNGPMKRILLILLLVYFGEAFRNAVSLFFIRDIVGLGSIGSAYFLYFVAGILAIPFWLGLGNRIGKHRAFMGTLIVVGCVSASKLPARLRRLRGLLRAVHPQGVLLRGPAVPAGGHARRRGGRRLHALRQQSRRRLLRPLRHDHEARHRLRHRRVPQCRGSARLRRCRRRGGEQRSRRAHAAHRLHHGARRVLRLGTVADLELAAHAAATRAHAGTHGAARRTAREPLNNSSSPLRPPAEAAIAAAAARRVVQPRLAALASGATQWMRPQVPALRGLLPAPAAALRSLGVTRHAFESAPCRIGGPRERRQKARGPDELFRGSLKAAQLQAGA